MKELQAWVEPRHPSFFYPDDQRRGEMGSGVVALRSFCSDESITTKHLFYSWNALDTFQGTARSIVGVTSPSLGEAVLGPRSVAAAPCDHFPIHPTPISIFPSDSCCHPEGRTRPVLFHQESCLPSCATRQLT